MKEVGGLVSQDGIVLLSTTSGGYIPYVSLDAVIALLPIQTRPSFRKWTVDAFSEMFSHKIRQ